MHRRGGSCLLALVLFIDCKLQRPNSLVGAAKTDDGQDDDGQDDDKEDTPYSGEKDVPHPAPLRWVERLSPEDLENARMPLLVGVPRETRGKLSPLGLDSFDSLRREFGDGSLLLGEERESFHSRAEPTMERHLVKDYVTKLLDPSERALRLSEMGGREFFIARPELYGRIARTYARILPPDYRMNLVFFEDKNFTAALANQEFGNSDIVLFAGDKNFTYPLHSDYVLGALLTHIEGPKRIWLYPESQEEFLYLEYPDGEDIGGNWEGVSEMVLRPTDGLWPDPVKYPLFSQATPVVVDLRPGETLYIPCGWGHLVEYGGPAMSLGVQFFPDWLGDVIMDNPGWTPKDCESFHRRPARPSAREDL
eukprot:TRINITY_DN33193_c0_g1_i1.p1 TRINITY_DN33193_c0_g1~~TRINITY_DN33193_c0_g1_i1.p1  ORF type:complete len:365 (+),score=52.21 TRINITY_DN33193_c0_g1_i1:94-1188(+)